MAKYNIKVQYGAWIAAVTLGTVMVLTGIHIWRDIDTQEKVARHHGTALAKAAAKAIAPSLAKTNVNAVIRALGQAVNDEDVQYFRVLDSNHQVLFKPPQYGEPVGLTMVSESVVQDLVQVGIIELGLSQTEMSRQWMRTLFWNLGIGVVLVAIFVFVSGFVSAPIRDSLANLQEFIRRVGAGENHGETLDSELTEVDDVAKQLTELMRRVEISQANLERAQAQLKSTQKEMDEYTYVISHDLKEPLRGINAFSKFLADGYRDKIDDDGRHQLDVIRNSALRMQRLIDDLLKFSRLGQQKNPMEVVGLNAMLMHVRVNLQYALDAKKVDLRVNKLPMIVCDATAMTEVFHNLISNAIKYNNKPHPIIEVGCEEKANPQTGEMEYEFHVRDNGLGIKKEYFDKIFQIFQRLQRDEKAGTEEGTGIGLTIVKRVIEWHGGRIWPESTEGEGTTFYFTIPKRELSKTGTIVDQSLAPPSPATVSP
jgi:signal transduction histidine kinase